jgi:hypothetical protein
MARDLPRDKAAAMADVNPQSALVYAVLDLAQAIRENGCELEVIGKAHQQLAVNIGGIDTAIADLGREIAHMPQPKEYHTHD